MQRPYNVVWTGAIEIAAEGAYNFGLETNSQAQLFIGGQLVVDSSGPGEYQEGSLELEAGRHDLLLAFMDEAWGSRLRLFWTPPNQERQIVPREVLFFVKEP